MKDPNSSREIELSKDEAMKVLAGKFFSGAVRMSKLVATLEEMRLEFREGKGMADLANAIKKGLKAGRGRSEEELNMIAHYLGDVFKLRQM